MIYIFKKRYFLINKEFIKITIPTEISIAISIPITPKIGININNNITLINEDIEVTIKVTFSLFMQCKEVLRIDSI